MGYGQRAELTIKNHSKKTLKITNLYLHWGKIYQAPDMDKDLGQDTINDKEISPGGEFSFATCGKKLSPSGTEGQFNIYYDGDQHACQIYWDCPNSGSNKLRSQYVKEKWTIAVPSVSPDGAIGKQTIDVVHLGEAPP